MKKSKTSMGRSSKTLEGRLGTAKKGMPRKGSNLPYCPVSKARKPGFGKGNNVKGV